MKKKWFKVVESLNDETSDSNEAPLIVPAEYAEGTIKSNPIIELCDQHFPNDTQVEFNLLQGIQNYDWLPVEGNFCIGILGSKRLMNILFKHKLPHFQVLPARINNLNDNENYFWLRITDHFFHRINFPKTNLLARSAFKIQDPISTNILSADDFFKFNENSSEILQFRPSNKYFFDIDYQQFDLIIINFCDNNIYVSEHLKSDLITSKIKGIDFQRTDRL